MSKQICTILFGRASKLCLKRVFTSVCPPSISCFFAMFICVIVHFIYPFTDLEIEACQRKTKPSLTCSGFPGHSESSGISGLRLIADTCNA